MHTIILPIQEIYTHNFFLIKCSKLLAINCRRWNTCKNVIRFKTIACDVKKKNLKKVIKKQK